MTAAGFTVDEVLSLTGMTVDVADNVGVMQEKWLWGYGPAGAAPSAHG
jgi:hypothetical protein